MLHKPYWYVQLYQRLWLFSRCGLKMGIKKSQDDGKDNSTTYVCINCIIDFDHFGLFFVFLFCLVAIVTGCNIETGPM